MSKEVRNNQSGDRDINHMSGVSNERKNYEGFEGMNYEQLRQPYKTNLTGRNRPDDERKDEKNPSSM